MKLKSLSLFVLLCAVAVAAVLNLRHVKGAQTDSRPNRMEAREELYRQVNIGIASLEQFKPEEAA